MSLFKRNDCVVVDGSWTARVVTTDGDMVHVRMTETGEVVRVSTSRVEPR